MSKSKIIPIDLIMLSRFGQSDGGMETWAYQFISLLLRSNENIYLHIFGIKDDASPNNMDTLRATIPQTYQHRLQITFFPCRKSLIPYFFQMLFQLKRYNTSPPPRLVLGVGGFFELYMVTSLERFKHAKRIMWFRTIFFNQGKRKIPKISLPLLRRWEVHLAKKIQTLLANGQDIANYFAKANLHVDVIPNAVDIKKWHTKEAKFASPIHIAFIGRLDKTKGIDAFLSAIELVYKNDKHPPFKFHIIGAGPFEESSMRLASEHKLHFHGQVSNHDIPMLLQQFDVCVALTYANKKYGGGGMSNALLEQMSAEKIIIAWDSVIFRQVLDEQSAFLIQEGDAPALEAAFYKISNNLTTAKERAKAAYLAAHRFSPTEHIKKFTELALIPNLEK